MLNIIVIDSSQPLFLDNFSKSLKDTLSSEYYSLSIEKEDDFREKTLNNILEKNKYCDILIFADDVILTHNWYTALKNNRENGDIIGFSNLYPNTTTIQDTGYDLVMVDDNVTTKARNRGKDVKSIKSFNFSQCDAVMGCAMYIKREVIRKIKRFSLFGYNRWGEIIFCHEAKKQGFEVAVLGHFLYHYGKSTKINPVVSYSSDSYLYEKRMWDQIVKKYINKDVIKYTFHRVISKKFYDIIGKSESILLYGAGTVTEFIIKKIIGSKYLNNIKICSGINEEDGLNFYGIKINHIENVNFTEFGIIIITVIGKHNEIIDSIKNKISNADIYYVTEITNKQLIEYDIRRI